MIMRIEIKHQDGQYDTNILRSRAALHVNSSPCGPFKQGAERRAFTNLQRRSKRDNELHKALQHIKVHMVMLETAVVG